MKSFAPLLLAGVLCGVATAAQTTSAPSVPVLPPTTINVPTTVSELANGYAAAVQQMSLKSLVIYYRGEKGLTPIKGIRTVRACSGVLLITFSAGDMMAISAESVVMITDGSRSP